MVGSVVFPCLENHRDTHPPLPAAPRHMQLDRLTAVGLDHEMAVRWRCDSTRRNDWPGYRPTQTVGGYSPPSHVQVTVVLGATALVRITGPHFVCRTLSGRTWEHH